MQSDNEIFMQLADFHRTLMLLIRLALDLLIVSAIIIPKFILKQRKEFAFSLYLFNFVIFALCYVILHTELGWTAGIGLFAIFAMLRFRSEMLNLLDMTYLLAIISVGFVNAAFNGSISFIEIVILNVGLISMVYTLDHLHAHTKLQSKKIKYNNLELIKPSKKEELVNDLKTKTGLKIEKVMIDNINLEEQKATVRIYYYDGKQKSNNGQSRQGLIHKIANLIKSNHSLQKS